MRLKDPSFTYKLWRFSSEKNSTLGLLVAGDPSQGEHFRCFTLEDEHRDLKVPGKTRIPAGKYEIKKRHGSPKFGYLDENHSWHNGMLHLQDVPGFTWVYIHSGVTHDHTAGCILVGDGAHSNVPHAGALTHSRDAYGRLYREASFMLSEGRRVFIEVMDYS